MREFEEWMFQLLLLGERLLTGLHHFPEVASGIIPIYRMNLLFNALLCELLPSPSHFPTARGRAYWNHFPNKPLTLKFLPWDLFLEEPS